MYPTLKDMFEQTVTKYPDREALVYPQKNQRWSFETLNEKANCLANSFLNAGLRKGDVVSVFLFNTSEFVATYLACIKTGILFNPINFRLSGEELAFILNDAQSKALIFEEAVIPQVEKARERTDIALYLYTDENNQPPWAQYFYDFMESGSVATPISQLIDSDRYIIMYTSGTTGKPKGVVHRHRDMIEHTLAMLAYLQISQEDRGLSAAPLNHSAELHCVLLPRINIGATSVLLHHFEPKAVLQCIQDERITLMFGAPTMWNMMLQENLSQYDLSHFNKILYGGAAMAPAMVIKCQEAFNADLIQAYGMTEMGPAVTMLMPQEQLPKAGSAGKAIVNHEVRVVRPKEGSPSDPDDLVEPGEKGEIVVRGPGIMELYYNRPDDTENAMYKGWYHSGDIATIDEEGYIWVADRIDDMIISGGENIYPREVEDVLYEHPDIVELAVVGLPDENWGKVVTAFVVRKNNDLSSEDLDKYLLGSQKLAKFKRPRRYEFVDTLPKTASGKIQKFVLVEDYS
ncbi:long-chain-fatty-acid--CoA ligase [Metallumcola ferriviriculae]|uniref:Long-chain-fatty-acid--CoA ligase n=1 Tax=Metallumcola ferriviriculae TaxID=3039180 RepID=A0AAU0UQZ2_9FIRM|nr:long-chain-fatty-acid--CoA ligase [Desulfitibacteraceae bacterium MK1]